MPKDPPSKSSENRTVDVKLGRIKVPKESVVDNSYNELLEMSELLLKRNLELEEEKQEIMDHIKMCEE